MTEPASRDALSLVERARDTAFIVEVNPDTRREVLGFFDERGYAACALTNVYHHTYYLEGRREPVPRPLADDDARDLIFLRETPEQAAAGAPAISSRGAR